MVEVEGSGDNIGGLVGYGAEIEDSYATGAVGGGDNVGGLAGYTSGVIQNNYAIGAVGGGDNVGGLVGIRGDSIRNSYATGIVQGNNVGGLVAGGSGALYYSYWNKETSGIINSEGNDFAQNSTLFR